MVPVVGDLSDRPAAVHVKKPGAFCRSIFFWKDLLFGNLASYHKQPGESGTLSN